MTRLDRLASNTVWLALAAFIAVRVWDFAGRVLGPNPVARAFGEGGDDGYFYLTIARNLASGLGATIDGTHWTSGFHPLWLLLTSVAFLLPGDRAALAGVYLESLALWLAGAALLIALVRRAVPKLDALTTAALAALFLCEWQLTFNYVNAMETGLVCTLLLAFLLVAQRYLAGEAHAIVLGVAAGLLMLARNDAVFLVGAVFVALLLWGGRRRRFAELVLAGLVASLLVAPWLVYCQWVAGVPVPQSGLATTYAGALRTKPDWLNTEGILAESIVPAFMVGMRTVAGKAVALAPLPMAVAAALGLVVLLAVTRPLRLLLLSLAVGIALLIAYYLVFSSAWVMYERYFTVLKLLVLLLLGLLLAQALPRAAPPARLAVLVVALAAALSNIHWALLPLGKPWIGANGEETLDFLASPYARMSGRIATAQSGRLGFLLPAQVVNLDGKVNLEALRAIEAGTLDRYIRRERFELILLHDYDAAYIDRRFPSWRQGYVPLPPVGAMLAFGPAPN